MLLYGRVRVVREITECFNSNSFECFIESLYTAWYFINSNILSMTPFVIFHKVKVYDKNDSDINILFDRNCSHLPWMSPSRCSSMSVSLKELLKMP